jgi:hypothetical protein
MGNKIGRFICLREFLLVLGILFDTIYVPDVICNFFLESKEFSFDKLLPFIKKIKYSVNYMFYYHDDICLAPLIDDDLLLYFNFFLKKF